ncbi:DUF5677 domain-containing protein [Ruegeria arenilitoris]|uniref:DUF5677 domain-containing protein n=1 Tax=Ruegeria arenilitoris TaxID=1173585 RepID=UPI00147F7EAD|nr:DUF5677 domain-containing protein [Ruegeria arenilitoris]
MTASTYDQKDTFFSNLSDPIIAAVERLVSEEGASSEKVEKFLEHIVSEGAPSLAENLKSGAPEMLSEEHQQTSSFKTRHLERWETPLRLLKVMRRSAQEAGEAHARSGVPDGVEPLVFDTLCILHPKALLITNEIICLLEGGFADGALARWRALHEVAVTAMFIASHDGATAQDYRLSAVFSDFKAARKVNEYADRNQMEPFSEAQIERMRRACDAAEENAGRRLKTDMDWAKPALGLMANQKATFFDLEKAVGMDHWRPRFRWACKHNHAGFTHPNALLGMSESTRLMHQIGPSDSGLADPLHMTAISLLHMTNTFLLAGQHCVGRLVMIATLRCLSDELGEAALDAQKTRPR